LIESWKLFIHVRSAKFSILEGEEEELVNPGTYGRALAIYLQGRLRSIGYAVPSYNCEDWGWWVEIEGAPFSFGVCINCGPGSDGSPEYACTVGLTASKVWSWKKFKRIDAAPWSDKLHDDLLTVFNCDPDIEVLGISEVCPVGPEEWNPE
jgi:hypothetical protein